MLDFLRLLLPLYFLIYFGVAFVLKSVLVAKKIGKSPLVLPKDDSAYGLIGIYFKAIIACIFIYLMFFAFHPQFYSYSIPIIPLETSILQYMGLVFLVFALIWTILAQENMKHSWRIGIDTKVVTPLVITGLFARSRNPIFLGMIVSLLGLLLLTPNLFTAIFFILGYVLIQIQIRLEEEFLIKQHGETYLNYKNKVRRFI